MLINITVRFIPFTQSVNINLISLRVHSYPSLTHFCIARQLPNYQCGTGTTVISGGGMVIMTSKFRPATE